jgi:CBS domain-containing protein
MLRLRDIMSTNVVTVSPEMSIREAMELFGKNHVSGAPVVSGGKLAGVVTGGDLMTFASALPGVPTERELADASNAYDEDDSVEQDAEDETEAAAAYFAELWDDSGVDASERAATVDTPEWNFLEEHDVSEVMTRAPLATLPPDAEVSTAADMMKKQKVHRVLVTDGEALVGIVTSMDITKAAADDRLDGQPKR